MNPTEFKSQMNKLLIFYRELPKGSEPLYWKNFKDISAKTFERACDIIINTHEEKSFPMVPVFNKAIDQASRDRSSSSDIIPAYCPYCNGAGITIVEAEGSSGVAHPCSCYKGQIYRRSFDRARIKIESRQHKIEKERQESEYIQQALAEEPGSTPDPY